MQSIDKAHEKDEDTGEMGGIHSVKTGFRIIDLLVSEDVSTLSEIATELEMPVSTTYGYLNTLRECGYVTKSGTEYGVSMQFLYLGSKLKHELPVFQASDPAVRDLAIQTGEYVTLMIEEDGYGVIVDQEKGERVQHIGIRQTHPGIREYLHVTGPGKVFLANKPDEWITEYVATQELASRTEHTITDPDELWSEIETIREDGHAYDYEETFLRMVGVAAPIYDDTNEVLAAISVYGPISRMDKKFDEIKRQLLETANMIELEMNYS